MAHAVDAEHDTPLNLGHALKISVGVLRERRDDREHEEKVHRNEERIDLGQVKADGNVLHGNCKVEGDDECVVSVGLVGVIAMNSRNKKEADDRKEKRAASVCRRQIRS